MISLKSISGAGGGLGLRPLGAIQTVHRNPVSDQAWLTMYNSTTFVQVHGLSIAKSITSYADSIEMRVTNLATGVVWATVSTPSGTSGGGACLIGHSWGSGIFVNTAAKISPSYAFEGGLKVEIRNTANTGGADLSYLSGRLDYTVVEER